MMSRFLVSILVLMSLFAGANATAATLYTYTNGGSTGLWHVAGTWTTDPSGLSLTGSTVPGNGDAVVILNGFTVTLGANVVETGLSITINNGGTLDLSTFTFPTISTLSGAGLLKIKSGYFPTVTTNNFASSAASGATVNYYDFSGTIPVSINYPNLTFSNSTATPYTISISNAATNTFTIGGNLVTQATGTGTLAVLLGTTTTGVISLTIHGNVTIGPGTTWGVGSFNVNHAVTFNGSMTNNGSVLFSNGTQGVAPTNGAASATFGGATDNTLACNGPTFFYTFTLRKGAGSTNVLDVTSTNTNNLKFYTEGKIFRLYHGTLRLGANIDIPRLNGTGNANFDIGEEEPASSGTYTSPMLWIDGAAVNTSAASTAALVVYGKFRITSGSFTTKGGEGSVIRLEGQYIIEGGTFTTEKFRPSTETGTHRGSFTMTGGTFNANGTGSNGAYARFSLPFPDQVFIMSGGTINVSNPQSTLNGGIHIGCNASNYLVTGGTMNAILSGGAAFYNISSTAPFHNLTITKTGGTPTTVRLAAITGVTNTDQTARPLTVLNDFTIDGTNTPTFNANGLNVTVGHDFTINAGGTYTPSANTTTFNGTGAQSFANNGVITSGLYNLTMNKASGVLTFAGSASIYTVAQTLTLTSGVLNDGGKTIQVAGNIHNEATHAGTGNITLNGAATQTISGDGHGTFGNLILNNASTPGASATADFAVNGTLTLAGTGNSLFDINQNLLSLNSSSPTALTTTDNPFSNAKMIRTSGLQSDNGIRKTFNDLSPFTFAFGVGSNYTPATIQLSSAPTTYGTITARPVSSRHQFIVAANTNNLTWYWKVNSSGFTGIGATAVSQTFQYVESSVAPGGDDVNYVPASYNPTSWSVISDLAQVNETTNIISFSSIGFIDGEFTAGVPSSFGPIKVFYSMANGNWDNLTTWSNTSHSGPADAITYPVVGDNVFIGDGSTFNHVITITSNAQAAGGLAINAGSTLDVGIYTGHNFGTFENSPITGNGTLRISSATATAEFPAGDFGNFIRATGGTVEYYTTGTQDFTIPVVSAAPTSLALISYKNLTITPASGRSILMPNQNMRVYGNMNVQGASSTGIARLNSTASRTLEIDGNLNVTSGTLQFENTTVQSLEVHGNISIGSTGVFNLAGAGTAVTNLLSLEGNLVNNGVFDMANTTYITNVTFTGVSNATITGTGSTTDFNILTVSKGTSSATVLNVNATAFTLSSATTPLVLNTGTFRLTSGQIVNFSSGVDFSIPSSAGLSANGGTLQLTGGNGIDLLLSGTLEVLNGTIDIGTTATDNSIEYAATGQPTIVTSGGTLNVRSQIRRSFASTQGALLYNQSGSGIVTVGISSATTTTRGVFEILNTGSSFTMTGGTLRIARALGASTIADLYLQPASSSITGGTIEIGASGTSQTIDINSITPVYNVSVTGTTNTARLETTGLTLRGSLNIAAGNIFNANSLNVSIAGDFTNSNTTSTTGVTVGGYRAGSSGQTTTLNGSLNHQNFTGVSGNLTNFGNLVINNTFASGIVTLQPNTNLRVNGTLILSGGTVAGGGNTITAISTVSNSVTQTNTAGGSITLAGASNQLITGSGSGKFGNLILNNASGATFGANQEITGVLTFTTGSLQIGSYLLNLSNTSLNAIVGATSTQYIITSGNLSDGGVTKAFAALVTLGNFTYPIGVSGKYTPAIYTITTGVIGGTINVKPVNSKHPSATGSGTSFINYYWNVSNSVIILTALTHTYTYTVLDEAGTPSDYRDARFKGGAWIIDAAGVADDPNPVTGTRVITFTNTDVAGDYTAGEPTAFVNPTTYTSHASGSWESEGTVWTPIPPGTGIGPPAGSFVIISAGDVITMTGNSKRMATLEVRGRLHLGNTNGHDFGTVTTSGAGDRTIQLQSSTFPSGDFTNFTAAGGGTVEYDGTVILPTQNTYNNITFTSAGTKTLPNADLTVNGNLTVFAGTATNAVNNRSIVLVSPTGDFTNNGVFTAGSGVILIGRNLVNSGVGAVFNGGTGIFGLQVAGSMTNSSSATFLMSTDSLGVRGSINNSATFTGSSGPIRVTGNVNNTGGTFTSGSGFVTVSGSLVNNATYTAGSGATTVKGSYTNSGASAIHNANANVMTITGNFTNSASANFNANSGSVLTRGNWINSATFTAGTGSVTFNSASAQTLTGTTTFYNLTRSAGGSLTMNNSIDVGNILTLTSGNIITGSNVVSLSNTTAQSVTGYSETSFIDGRLSTSFPNTASTSRIYPVGKGSIYRPVTITQTAASTTPVVRVEMVDDPPAGTIPPSVGILSEARYYAIDLTSGTMNSPTVSLSFNTNGAPDENVYLAGNTRILRTTNDPLNPGTAWTDEGGTGVFTPAAPAGIATSGITSIVNPNTYFALGYQNGPLPITLASFKGVLKNEVVELSWSTYTEKNNAYFTVERSSDGLAFDELGSVDGAGNSHKTLYYHMDDANPLPDISYYRLKQTDYDNRFTYSEMIRIVNPRSEHPSFVVYPVPSRVSDPLTLKLINSTSTQAYLSITDVAGRIFYEGHVNLAAELNLTEYLTSRLERGIYLIHVVSGSLNDTKRIILY